MSALDQWVALLTAQSIPFDTEVIGNEVLLSYGTHHSDVMCGVWFTADGSLIEVTPVDM